jgi:hypothetical protein
VTGHEADGAGAVGAAGAGGETGPARSP